MIIKPPFYYRTLYMLTFYIGIFLWPFNSVVAEEAGVQYNDYGKPINNTQGQFIVNRAVNLRSEAGMNSDVIAVLPKGTNVFVTKSVHGFYSIQYKGVSGYAWHQFFDFKQP